MEPPTLPALESVIRTIKGFLAMIVAVICVMIMMPMTDQMITDNATPGTIWGIVARMGMWAFYLMAIVGSPILVTMGKATVYGILKGSGIMLIGTVFGMILIPFIDNLATSLLTDFWLLGAQIGIYITFLCLIIILPLFTIIGTQEEFGGL